jgi:hypothetical protein
VRAVVCLIVGSVAGWAALTPWAAPATAQPVPAAADRPYGGCPGPAGQYAGTSCSAASCHGGQAGRPGGEHTSWAPEVTPSGPHDPHARAYRVLFNEDSRRMARLLGLGNAHEAALCLKCHAVGEPGSPAVAEGVGCVGCHGPADKWLVAHYQPEWKGISNRDKFEQYKFVPTKNVVARVLVCTTCHVGDADREVNHDLIAAGHPRLAFEYTRFHFNPVYRKHWTETTPQPDFEVRAWAIGQVATARQAAELLRVRAARAAGDGGKPPPGVNPTWPEFEGYSCYACHQSIGDEEVRRGSAAATRRAGSLAWEPWSTSAVGAAEGVAGHAFKGAGPIPLGKLTDLRATMVADRAPKPGVVRDQAAEVVKELDRWLAAAQALEDEDPGRRLPRDVAPTLVRFPAAAALNDKGSLRDHDWDFLAAHYLGCAALAHAAGGRAAGPDWGPALDGLRTDLGFPPAGYNSPRGFGPENLLRIRLGFERLAK